MSGDGWVRLLLRLYPREFRRSHGAEWLQVLQERRRRAAASGATSRFWLYVLRDSLLALPTAHAARLGGRFGGMPRDVTFALRGLLRRPGFTAATVGVLAVGIGANTAIFSVVNAAMVRPLPYPQAERLTIVWNDLRAAGFADAPLSAPQLLALQEAEGIFADVGGVWATSATVTGLDRPEQLSLGLVTWNFLNVLGMKPYLGRLFDAGDVIGDGAVVISHRLWQGRFGADPTVLGRTLWLEGEPVAIVGVLPDSFRLLFPAGRGVPAELDVFVPYPVPLSEVPAAQYFFRVVGRLQPGVTVAVATEEVEAIAAQLRDKYALLADGDATLDLRGLPNEWLRDVRPALVALQTAVALLLLLTTANVASLLIARTASRRHELAVRASLGASRGRLVRQLLVEVGLLAALGALLGLGLGSGALRLLWSLRPPALDRIESVALDPTVLGYTTAAAVVSALLFGLAPMFEIRRLNPAQGMVSRGVAGSRGGERVRRVVTVLEVALGLVLLVGAGLMTRSLSNLGRVDPGFESADRLAFKVALSPRRFPQDSQRSLLSLQIEEALRELPGVTAAGAVSHLPLVGWPNWASPAWLPESGDDAAQQVIVDHRTVTPGYLEAMGTRLVEGRHFEVSDDATTRPVIVVDTVLADRFWPGQTPIGRGLMVSQYVDRAFRDVQATVVGLIGPIRDQSPAQPSEGQIYLPFAQSPRWELSYVVHADRASELVESIRVAIGNLDADLAGADFRLLETTVGQASAGTRFSTWLATVFAVAAMVVAAVGLYSVVAYRALARTREIGVRIALGARAQDIFRSVLGDGLTLGGLGVLIGLPSAVAVSRLLESMLFGVGRLDAWTYVGVTVLLAGVVLLAGAVPGARARRVDPIEALRAE